MIRTVIKGTGCYIPDRVIKNGDFLNHEFYEKTGIKLNKPNQGIIDKLQEITEIKERRYAQEDLMNSDIAAIASKRAIDQAMIDPEQIDYIIAAHNYGDVNIHSHQSNLMPSISAKVKNKLGIKNIYCKPYDMIFGCPGWIEGIILSDQLFKLEKAKNILVVGAETLSRVLDPYDRNCMIFSDGAGAALLSAVNTDKPIGVIEYNTRCDNNKEIYYLSNKPSLNPDYKESLLNIGMEGKKIYEYALTYVPNFIKDILDKANLSIRDIKKIFIHQANAKMDYAILKRLLKLYDITYDSKVHESLMPMTIQKLGNSSVATVPTLLAKVFHNEIPGHALTKGDKIIMVSLGAGMHINGLIYELD